MRLGLALMLLAPVSALATNVLVVPSDEARTLGLSDAVVDLLSNAGVPLKVAGPKAPAVACTHKTRPDERRACLADIATRANVASVLVLGATEQRRVATATLELIAQADGKLLKTVTIRAPTPKWGKQAGPQLKPLRELIAAQRFVSHETGPAPIAETPVSKETPPVTKDTPRVEPPPTPVETSDRPTEVALTPKEDEVRTDLTEPRRSSHVAAWSATGVAMAAAATSATFGLLGASSKARLETAPEGIAVQPYNQSLALQAQANAQLTTALVVGIVALVSGTTAALLWGLDP